MRKLLVTVVGACALAFSAAADSYFDPLTIAAIKGDAALVAEQLEDGADPNALSFFGLTPLAAAMRSCRMNVEVLDLLVAAGADIEARSGVGTTPLMIAWQTGRPELAEALLAAGADEGARNIYGDTAADYREFFAGDASARTPGALRYVSYGFMTNADGYVVPDCD